MSPATSGPRPVPRTRIFAVLFVASGLAAASAWGGLRLIDWRRMESHAIDLSTNTAPLAELLLKRAEEPRALAGLFGTGVGTFLHETLDEATARVLYGQLSRDGYVYDPPRHFRRAGPRTVRRHFPEHPRQVWKLHTNSRGMRRKTEASATAPELRVLVTGDSHTEGVCPNEESFAARLESLLTRLRKVSVEVLNCGLGGYTLHDYIGVLEAMDDLKPQVFVVAIYGGNDYAEMMPMLRYYERLGPPRADPYRLPSTSPDDTFRIGIHSQELYQAAYFLNNPDDEALAARATQAFTLEVARLCAERAIHPIFVYIPPPTRGQEARYLPSFLGPMRDAGLNEKSLTISDRISDAWITFARSQQFTVLDLRQAFAEASTDFYWHSDHHINSRAHDWIAQRIVHLIR